MAVLSINEIYALLRKAGASPDEAAVFAAIAMPESGGNTEVRGDGGASIGLFQIYTTVHGTKYGSIEQLMDPWTNVLAAKAISNNWTTIAPWSVTHTNTGNKYAAYRTAAEQAAKAYGDTLSGTAWWGGTRTGVNKAPTTDGPNSSGGDGGGSPVAHDPAAGQPSLPPNATPQQIEDYVRKWYPQVAPFLDIPEIRLELIKAAQQAYTADQLQGAIQATTWWRTNGEVARKYFALQATDPQSLKELIAAKVAELGPQMRALGITDNIEFFAEGALKYGWTPDQIQQMFAASLTTLSKREGLTEGSTPDVDADRLMAIARTEYFLPVSRSDAERWAIDIYSGAKTEEQIRNYFAQISAARFPGITEQGFTPGEYMAPIRQAIADILEVSAVEVDFLDPRYSAVLEQEGKNGMRPMSIAEASRWARSLPQYKTTKGALDQAASLGDFIGKAFGAVA